MIKILIDRLTIRRNPNAGRTSILVPGRSCIVDGKETKQIQRVHTIYPEGAYLFEYAHTKVQCCHCEAVFDYYLLESDCSIDIDGETYSDTICPKCHGWDCCEMEFEEFDEKTMVPEEQKESKMEDLRTTREEAVKLLQALDQEMAGKLCPILGTKCLVSGCMSYRSGKIHDDISLQRAMREGEEALGHFIVTSPRCVNRTVNGDI